MPVSSRSTTGRVMSAGRAQGRACMLGVPVRSGHMVGRRGRCQRCRSASRSALRVPRSDLDPTIGHDKHDPVIVERWLAGAMWQPGRLRGPTIKDANPFLPGRPLSMSKVDLVTPYKEYFKIIAATTDELRDRVFALRYEVYCKELGWEDAAAFPDQRETDAFDDDAVHCLLFHRRSGRDAGTVRLVRSRPEDPEPRLPLIEHYDRSLFRTEHNPLTMPKGCFGEISRLALHEQFRRRPGEQSTPEGHGTELFQWTQDDRRRFPHMALGLYLAAATIGLSEGMEGVYAMMEPRLARHLHFGGIYFEQVGEAIEFRGARAPFYISRQMLFERLTPPLQALLDAIAEDLDVAL
ncbi:hypothetical protein CKO17_02740 [Marichromatium gracile]|nr:hypothetical protein [Marichromatium gracile]